MSGGQRREYRRLMHEMLHCKRRKINSPYLTFIASSHCCFLSSCVLPWHNLYSWWSFTLEFIRGVLKMSFSLVVYKQHSSGWGKTVTASLINSALHEKHIPMERSAAVMRDIGWNNIRGWVLWCHGGIILTGPTHWDVGGLPWFGCADRDTLCIK